MKHILLIFTLILSLGFSSCQVQRIQVGNYENQEGKSQIYEQGKNFHLFWDLVPLKEIEKNLSIQDYEIVQHRSLFDNIVYYGTIGIFSFHTVKIKYKSSKAKNKM